MTEFILNAIAQGGYIGIFLLMALENVVPPIPSEVIMGLGGMAVARGDMAIVPLVLWGTAGTTAGNYFWYFIGRHIGYQRFRPFIERHGRWLTMEWEDVEKLHRFFCKRGGGVVFVFRFMPTFRTLVSLPAGMTCMPLWRFLVWTFAGSLIWNRISRRSTAMSAPPPSRSASRSSWPTSIASSPGNRAHDRIGAPVRA